MNALDAALPRERDPFPDTPVTDAPFPDTPGAGDPATHVPIPVALPTVDDAWITETVDAVIATYGRTFAAQWADDASGLRTAAIDLLERFDLVVRVPGGLLIRPTLARYRGVVVTVRDRAASVLFSTGLPDDPVPDPISDPMSGPGPDTAPHPAAPHPATTTAETVDDAEEIE